MSSTDQSIRFWSKSRLPRCGAPLGLGSLANCSKMSETFRSSPYGQSAVCDGLFEGASLCGLIASGNIGLGRSAKWLTNRPESSVCGRRAPERGTRSPGTAQSLD